MKIKQHADRRRFAWPILLLVSMLSLVPPASYATDSNGPVYSLGVFPHLPPRDLEKVFAPMAADLAKALGVRVELHSSTTYRKFAERLDQEQFDIAFVQPFDYVRAADKHGYLPLATRTEKLSTIVVTRTDSPLNSIQDLRNKKVALPPRTAAVSQLLRGYLKSQGIDPDRDIKLSYHRSHVSCMQQVLIGEAVACGTAAPARRFFQSKFNIPLKVIASSREIPHTLWVAHKRLPAEVRKKLRAHIINWSNTREGQALLERGKLMPFVPVSDKDYDVVRKLAR